MNDSEWSRDTFKIDVYGIAAGKEVRLQSFELSTGDKTVRMGIERLEPVAVAESETGELTGVPSRWDIRTQDHEIDPEEKQLSFEQLVDDWKNSHDAS